MSHRQGRELELSNSFELAVVGVEADGATAALDREFFLAREAAYKEVFPDLETLGWYRLGDQGQLVLFWPAALLSPLPGPFTDF